MSFQAPGGPRRRRALRRLPALSAAVLLVTLAGCFGLFQAHVPPSLLGEWRQTDEGDGGSFLNIAQEYTYVVYEYAGSGQLSGPYPGSLSVLSLETFGKQSGEELRDRLEEQLLADSEEEGIALDVNSRLSGGRTLASGVESQYFTYRGTSGEGSELFQEGRQVRVIGEVFTDEESGIHVLCVGFAQVTGSGTGGFFTNDASWRRIVEDPRGTIDNARGDSGLIHNIVSHD